MPAGPLEKGIAMAGGGGIREAQVCLPQSPYPPSCRLCRSDNFNAPPSSPKGPSRGLAKVAPPELPRVETPPALFHPRAHAHSPCKLSGARPALAGVCVCVRAENSASYRFPQAPGCPTIAPTVSPAPFLLLASGPKDLAPSARQTVFTVCSGSCFTTT